MSTSYVSGPYTSGQLLHGIRAVEDWITGHAHTKGAVTDPILRQDMDRRVRDASRGRNAVIFDDKDWPSIMVRVPAFTLDQIGYDGSNAYRKLHPAFIVDGKAVPAVWIAKYQAGRVGSGADERPVSLRGVDPWVGINFDNSRAACFDKGEGWHLMTNAEWAAIALWCAFNGYYPRGNNQDGRDYSRRDERGEATHSTGGNIGRVGTGTGPVGWSHDGSPFGIWDLNGNVWEWIDGLKLVNGKIYVHADNTFTTGNAEGSVDDWVDTERYYDNSQPGNGDQTSSILDGSIVLNDQRQYPMYTGGDANNLYAYNRQTFRSTEAADGVTVPDLLRHLAIMPPEDVSLDADRLYVRNYGERLPWRGGTWTDASDAGVFLLILHNPRSKTIILAGGFRSAWIET